MASYSEFDVLECACLHKQITERIACIHLPRHLALGEAVIRLLGSTDLVTKRAVLAACAGLCRFSRLLRLNAVGETSF